MKKGESGGEDAGTKRKDPEHLANKNMKKTKLLLRLKEQVSPSLRINLSAI